MQPSPLLLSLVCVASVFTGCAQIKQIDAGATTYEIPANWATEGHTDTFLSFGNRVLGKALTMPFLVVYACPGNVEGNGAKKPCQKECSIPYLQERMAKRATEVNIPAPYLRNLNGMNWVVADGPNRPSGKKYIAMACTQDSSIYIGFLTELDSESAVFEQILSSVKWP